MNRLAQAAAFAALLVLASGLAMPGAEAQLTRNRDMRLVEPDDRFELAYLTWREGAGGLAWDSAAATDPVTPDPGAVPVDQNRAEWAYYFATGDSSRIPKQVFVSPPTNRVLYLNASRHIEVDLNKASSACCTHVAVELYANDTFLGGQFEVQGVNVPQANNMVYRRVQPEIRVIPEGSTIKLVVLRKPGDGGFAWKLTDYDRSVVRLPVFSEQEVFFRVPEFVEPEETSPPDDASGDAAALAPLSMVGLLAVGSLRRRSGRVVLLALLVLSLGLAGCAGKSAPQTSTQTSAVPTATATGGLVAGEKSVDGATGDLVGQVRDDQNRPVAGAFLSVLGTASFTRSAGYGEFRIVGLAPGAHVLRIDAEGHGSLETGFEIEAGKVTRLTITLPSLTQGDFRAHQHDYWGDARSKTVYDADLPATTAFAPCTETGCFWEFRIPETDDNDDLVLPGTQEIEVKVTWDAAQNRIWALGLGFEDNSDPGFITPSGTYVDNATILYPRGRDGEATFRFQTGWEMTDVGHQSYSTWAFFIYVPDSVDLLIRKTGGIANVGFHVQITLQKGVVPFEPAHRDFWGEENSLHVIEGASLTLHCETASPDCPKPNALPHANVGWKSIKLVPPETRRLVLRLDFDRVAQPTAYDWALAVKPANIPPSTTAGDFSRYQTLVASNSQELRKEFTMLLKPGEADAFYARKSWWDYRLDDQSTQTHSVNNGPIRFTLTVTAYRDEPQEPTGSGLAAALPT